MTENFVFELSNIILKGEIKVQNIKYIKRITDEICEVRHILGNCVYYKIGGNRVKTYCDEYGVWMEIVNPRHGLIDKIHLPFSHYFEPVQCSKDAPKWTQSIERDGTWRFEKMYPHTLPKASDYKRIAEAMDDYMELFN